MAKIQQYQQRQKQESNNIRLDDLITVEPMTENQNVAFEAWKGGNHLALVGTAGTGKTFLGIYLALELVMDRSTKFDKLVIVRSIVPTREVGYLPGTLEEKLEAYTGPYRQICAHLFEDDKAFDKLKEKDYISFESTSYIRGVTYDNAIILVDEMQNLNFHELDSIITRVGIDTRIIFSGDYLQSDFVKMSEKQGINVFLEILEQLKQFDVVHFDWKDIVRSDFVRDYIMTKDFLGIK